MHKMFARLAEDLIVPGEAIKEYSDKIEQTNSRSLFVLSMLGTGVSAVLVVLSLPFIGVLRLFSSYLILMLTFFLVAFLSQTVLMRHKQYMRFFYYLLMVLIEAIGIYMGTVQGQTTNATTYLLFALLLPLFVIDYPWRLILVNACITAAFIFCVLTFKAPGEIRSLDISNSVCVFFIGAIFIILTVQRNVRSFALQRREEEEIKQKNELINLLPVGIAVFDVQGGATKQVYTNDEFYRLFDDTPEGRAQRTKGNFMNGIHPDDRAKLAKAIQSVIDGSNYVTQPCRAIRGDSTYMWVRFSSSVAKREGDYIQVFSTYSSMEDEMKSKQATQAKTEFLSRMSHDIRTPMNAIIGLTNLAKTETDLNEVHKYLDNISASSDFLLGLINDILDLSKIESGEFSLNPEPYYGQDFFATLTTIICPMMESRSISFVCDAQDKDACLMVDKLRFNQIFLNLLSNACKFTPEGGTVSCTETSLPDKNGMFGMRIIVKDNGIGMSEEFQKNMFTPFSQERTVLNDGSSGTGLGLPIVKNLVEAMGGTISVESKQGEGTTYTLDFYFPRADKKQLDTAAPQTNISLKGKKILLVEDNKMNIIVAKKLLDTEGCIVALAQNGVEALDSFEESEEGSIDAILMDVRMPVMDGLEATRRIRALNRADAKTVPIIAMTADAFSQERKKTLDAGMNAHLSKPIDPQLMYSTISSWISRRK